MVGRLERPWKKAASVELWFDEHSGATKKKPQLAAEVGRFWPWCSHYIATYSIKVFNISWNCRHPWGHGPDARDLGPRKGHRFRGDRDRNFQDLWRDSKVRNLDMPRSLKQGRHLINYAKNNKKPKQEMKRILFQGNYLKQDQSEHTDNSSLHPADRTKPIRMIRELFYRWVHSAYRYSRILLQAIEAWQEW